jgi:hypothetical protein
VQPLDPLRERVEVRQQSAQPAMVDVRHFGGLGVLADGVLGLLLSAHKQYGPAAPRNFGRKLPRLLQKGPSLEKIDDVDAVALAEDETAHLRVPAPGLVAEMDSGLQQLLNSEFSHVLLPLVVSGAEPAYRQLRTSAGPRQGRNLVTRG